MYKVSSEQCERIAKANSVSFYLAQKGFTVYLESYEHSVKLDILADTYKEAFQAIEAMKRMTDLYKSRILKQRKNDKGKIYYWITYRF